MAERLDAIVVDANLTVALALPLPYSERAAALVEDWRRDRVRLYAPLLWEYELTTALRKAVALRMLTSDQAQASLERLWRLGIERVAPDAALHREALRWAEQLGQTAAHDSQYLALAARLGARLYTADRRLAERARALGTEWVHTVAAPDAPGG